ncbi:hypothetical protein A1O1_05404 [Capronia coronata CBS 617.96]|uniref:Developmental regulatory protein wetA n=1 Tax=Capronia coronata CBS 617.96 TaxID=1182541 RepID=W9Z1U1_9EURO|nr:uncharacterized protein A1O1_05404 [Capronia coronata CBS 617.96]EXJ88474.1 hypothetical protein A1O1_05404 [Capronia coronata CBS 617.96]
MSLASSPDCLFRPEDKALKMLFPTTVDEGSQFDEFFNQEMYKLDGSDEENKEHYADFEDVFSNQVLAKDQYGLPSLDTTAKAEHSPPQPWRQGVWCLKQRQQPARFVVEKTRRHETKRPGPIQTMKTVPHYTDNAHEPFWSVEAASPSRTKRFATSPAAQMYDPSSIRPPISREVTLSPSPMYSQFPISPRLGHVNSNGWQQDFQNFHLRMPYESHMQHPSEPMSPVSNPNSARALNAGIMAQNQAVWLPDSGYQEEYGDAESTSAIDPWLIDQHQSKYQESQSGRSQDSLVSQHQATSHGLDAMPSPISGGFPSSDGSAHSHEARTHTSSTNISTLSQAMFSPPPMSAHPPLPMLAPEETYPALAAPKPLRTAHQILHQATESAQTGLGIQYPELEQMDQAVFYEPQAYLRQAPPPVGIAVLYPATTMPVPAPMTSRPPLPPPPSYVFTEPSPFTTPRKQRRSPSRSPSPSVSPTNVSPRRNPRRSPNRNVTEYSHSRRKSIHKQGPIRDMAASEPFPPPRTRSASRPPRTPKTPKTPKTPTGGTVIDFVNFTPRDSAKLLNDVAPSGSSKTRARRELEAREKRKKLSEAALKAVKVAGGDVEAFEKAIFT